MQSKFLVGGLGIAALFAATAAQAADMDVLRRDRMAERYAMPVYYPECRESPFAAVLHCLPRGASMPSPKVILAAPVRPYMPLYRYP